MAAARRYRAHESPPSCRNDNNRLAAFCNNTRLMLVLMRCSHQARPSSRRPSKPSSLKSFSSKRLPKVLHSLPHSVAYPLCCVVLESHILACLHPEAQQLILIGDHKQLQPKTAHDTLTRKYNLHVSMFERLMTAGNFIL